MIDTTFRFADLSDTAKQRAIEWYREGTISDWEPRIEYYTATLEMLGFEVATETVKLMGGKTRTQSSFGYSIGYCQDDYANFSGKWYASKLQLGQLQEDRPTDATLLNLGAQLMAVYLRWPGATCDFSAPGAHSLHINWAYTDEDDPEAEGHVDDDQRLEDDLREIINGIFSWLYYEMRGELEFYTSDEACTEGIEANEYDFYEDGSIA